MRFIYFLVLFFSLTPLKAFEVLGYTHLDLQTLGQTLSLPDLTAYGKATYFTTLEDDTTFGSYLYIEPLDKEALFAAGSGFEFIEAQGGYFLKTPNGSAQKNVPALLKARRKLPDEPLIAHYKVAEIYKAAQKNPELAQAMEDIPQLAGLICTDISHIELKGTLQGDPLRLILVIKAQDSSPLAKLLNQRLPAAREEFLGRFGTKGCSIFGYLNQNIPAFLDYRRSLAATTSSDTDSATAAFFALPDELLRASDGVSVFFLNRELHFTTVSSGHWNETQMDALLRNEAAFQQRVQGNLLEITRAFNVAEIPVWETKIDGRQADSFYALHRGDLINSTASAEDFSAFLQSLSAPIASEESFFKRFNYYPTVCGQAFIYPKMLYAALRRSAPLPLPAENFDNQPIYVAASLAKGQLGLTIDIPQTTLKASRDLALKFYQIIQTMQMLRSEEETRELNEFTEELKKLPPPVEPTPKQKVKKK